ncbi:MAG: hypothetical protein NVSMB51_05520 [Solirubrobacteraceae bacterium]
MPTEPYHRSREHVWKRFLIGSVLIVVLMATATASAVLLEVGHVAGFFSHATLPGTASREVSAAQAGAAQTFLVIGSDKRALSSNLQDRNGPPHSDTLMLIRMDPNQGQTSVLSIPRDLRATFSCKGRPSTQKINAAYSCDGAAGAVRAIKRNLPGITINHIIDINFKGFRRVIDAIGCVYVFVDRRYYHSNVGLPPSLQYAEINVQPGYQKLCGQPALDYARYRHTDTDFVRVARQQDFVRQVKQQVGVRHLLDHQDQLFSALQRAVQTDVHGSGQIFELGQLAAYSLGRPVRQVHFQAFPGPSYVIASAAEISRTVNDFLHGNPAKTVTLPAATANRKRKRAVTGGLGLNPTPASDLGLATGASVGLPFKMYVPRQRVGGVGAPDAIRRYTIRDISNKPHHAYTVSIARGIAGEYYGIEGMDWTNPPILENPSQTRTVGGRTYRFYVDGGHLRQIAWKSGSAVYWVNNTLLASLSNRQMLAIAQSAQPVN